MLRRLVSDPRLQPTTLAANLERNPPARRLALPESSWGAGKRHGAWVSPQTRWIWEALRAAEERFAHLPTGPARDAAWRQLTLLQSSDWPFLIVRDQSTQYARERVLGNLARFEQACRGENLDALAAQDGVDAAPATVPA